MAAEDRSLQHYNSIEDVIKSTPDGRSLINILRASGLWLPPSGQPVSRKKFRTDISSLSSQELGDASGYWQSELSRVVEMLGILESEEVALKSQVQRAKYAAMSEIVQTYKDNNEKPPSVTLLTSEVALHSQVIEYEDVLSKVKRLIIVLTALRESFEGYRATLSREITRRTGGFSSNR